MMAGKAPLVMRESQGLHSDVVGPDWTYLYDRSGFEFQLDRIVDEVFSLDYVLKNPYDLDARMAVRFPSTSSNYNNSCGKGGCVGSLRDHEEFKSLGIGRSGYELSFDQDNFRVAVEGTQKIKDRFQRFWFWMMQKQHKIQDWRTKPLGLREALKVRVITKGPVFAQTLFIPLQKYMFKALSRFRCFHSLICGGQLTGEFLRGSLGPLKKNCKFLSGDYEAATDNLYSWTSERVARRIAINIGLSGAEKDMFLHLLTGHTIEYNNMIRQQVRGQLMGSIVSFPILCLINAALCRTVLEVDSSVSFHKDIIIPLSEAPMQINGDDLILQCTQFGYQYWSILGKEVVGL
jgi:hypothetical protein